MRAAGLALSLALVIAGLLAAPAGAGVRHFHGRISGGGVVDFDVLYASGKPKKAGNFELENVPVRCDPNNTRVDFSTASVVPVDGRKFVYVFRGFTAKIAGRLKPNGILASGNVDYGPNDLDTTGRMGCTTDGPRGWNAHR